MPKSLHDQRGRSHWPFLLAAGIIIAATAVMFYLNRMPPDAALPDLAIADTAGTVQRDPLPAQPTPTRAEPPPPQVVATPPEPLPTLDDSDGEIHQRLLAATPGLAELLINEAILRKFVVLVDNLARGKIAPRYNPVQPPAGIFTVTGDDPFRINPTAFNRYNRHAELLLATDPDLLVRLYWRYYPLLQQAYVDLGYPRAQFHPRLLTALDLLITAPLVPVEADLVQPRVLYQYANPALEQLPAAQKQLMRAGPDNQTRIQQRLRLLRGKLAQ